MEKAGLVVVVVVVVLVVRGQGMWWDGLVKNLEILGSCDMTITVLSPFATDLRIYLKQARARVNKLQKDAVEAKALRNNSKHFFILTFQSVL